MDTIVQVLTQLRGHHLVTPGLMTEGPHRLARGHIRSLEIKQLVSRPMDSLKIDVCEHWLDLGVD